MDSNGCCLKASVNQLGSTGPGQGMKGVTMTKPAVQPLPTSLRDELLKFAQQGVAQFLELARSEGRIDPQSYEQAVANVIPAVSEWLSDPHIQRLSPRAPIGLAGAICEQDWEGIVNAYRQRARFGTGGIRGMMAFDRHSIERLASQGIDAPILKGPNTINDIVLLRTSAGVAQFGQHQNPPLRKVVIGYDSRVRGYDFAKLVAELFLAYDYTVYFFDEPCPYPEMTFAIPYREVKGDIGILISASHNDYRYNGYKLSCGNGSQFDPQQRDEMYKRYIVHATTADIRRRSFAEAAPGQLIFLGGDQPVTGFDYHGRPRINLHQAHCNHVKSFLMATELASQEASSANPLRIAFCPFHGAGRRAVPRMLAEAGFRDVRVITAGGLNDLNGLFPSFEFREGLEQQPDPGDVRAARTAVAAFKSQPELGDFADIDILIGTDPDADRCGVVVKVPPDQRELFGGEDWHLLPADSMWALLLWYRFHRETEQQGRLVDVEKKFIVQSHTTTDGIILLARKYGLGVIKTWVGFAALAAAVRDVWEKKPMLELHEGRHPSLEPACHPFICEYQGMAGQPRSINVAAMEQSNGFSILGGPPPDAFSLGTHGHVRDKDGTLAALLVAEIAAWAKAHGTSLFELIDQKIHLDPEIGLFVNLYEPDPLDGEYPGIQGDQKKKAILARALDWYRRVRAGEKLTLAGRPLQSAVLYRTGKYDAIYPPTADFEFPDEGIRFYLESPLNHVTIRPSGTGNSLRFHIQLHEPKPGPGTQELIASKRRLQQLGQATMDDLRQILAAPR